MSIKISIRMLNVKDGDAIIVLLEKTSKSFLILIDGGHPLDSKIVLPAIKPFLRKTKKKAPDLIICTHYDNDHIGGLFGVINHFGSDIGEIWMHNTTSIVRLPEPKAKASASSIFPSEDDTYLKNTLNEIQSEISTELEPALQSLKQEMELYALIKSKGISLKEPIVGNCKISGWSEIKLIGPTEVFFKKLFPKAIPITTYLQNELQSQITTPAKKTKVKQTPCATLDSLPKAKVTSVNLISAILLIKLKDKKFLFTADAGIESFESLENYSSIIKDIFWLKVPHHASRNNINSKLISLMSPVNSFVSGDKHISPEVIDCLKSNKSKVASTKEAGKDLEFSYESK